MKVTKCISIVLQGYIAGTSCGGAYFCKIQCSLVGTKVISRTDHEVLRCLMLKKDVKQRLIR